MKRLIVLLLVALSLLPISRTARADAAVRLVYTYHKGLVYKYGAKIYITITGQKAQVAQSVAITITDIKPDGSAVIKQVDKGSKITLQGNTMDGPPGPPVFTTRRRTGQLVDLKMNDNVQTMYAPEIMRLMASITQPIFADKAVMPGTTWKTSIANPAVKGKTVTITTTFLGTDRPAGRRVWRVRQTAEAATDKSGTRMTVRGLYWLDAADGSEIRSEATVTNVPTQFGNIGFRTTTSRIEAKKK